MSVALLPLYLIMPESPVPLAPPSPSHPSHLHFVFAFSPYRVDCKFGRCRRSERADETGERAEVSADCRAGLLHAALFSIHMHT